MPVLFGNATSDMDWVHLSIWQGPVAGRCELDIDTVVAFKGGGFYESEASLGAKSTLASQILCLLWNPKDHYHVHKCPPMDLTWTTLPYTLPSIRHIRISSFHLHVDLANVLFRWDSVSPMHVRRPAHPIFSFIAQTVNCTVEVLSVID
jgi:hypothetical protein